jgi:hypothetical protein
VCNVSTTVRSIQYIQSIYTFRCILLSVSGIPTVFVSAWAIARVYYEDTG